jgi:hypothetical protein
MLKLGRMRTDEFGTKLWYWNSGIHFKSTHHSSRRPASLALLPASDAVKYRCMAPAAAIVVIELPVIITYDSLVVTNAVLVLVLVLAPVLVLVLVPVLVLVLVLVLAPVLVLVLVLVLALVQLVLVLVLVPVLVQLVLVPVLPMVLETGAGAGAVLVSLHHVPRRIAHL